MEVPQDFYDDAHENVTDDPITILEYDKAIIVATCIIQAIIFVVGFVGNSLVIIITGFKIKKSIPTILIMNLAIADFILILTLPLWIVHYALDYHWPYGHLMCKIMPFISYVNVTASIYFVTTLSLDRFLLALQHSWVPKIRTMNNTILVCFGVWLFASLLSIPTFVFSKALEHNGQVYCYQDNDLVDHAAIILANFVINFLIPITVMSFCYLYIVLKMSRVSYSANRRAINLIIAIVVVFCLCWLPYFLVDIVEGSLILHDVNKYWHVSHETNKAKRILISLAFSHSCLNPILYAFLAKGFRTQFKSAFILQYFEHIFYEKIPNVPEETQLTDCSMPQAERL
ncbi:unnamed protein product [Lampetra planeri]